MRVTENEMSINFNHHKSLSWRFELSRIVRISWVVESTFDLSLQWLSMTPPWLGLSIVEMANRVWFTSLTHTHTHSLSLSISLSLYIYIFLNIYISLIPFQSIQSIDKISLILLFFSNNCGSTALSNLYPVFFFKHQLPLILCLHSPIPSTFTMAKAYLLWWPHLSLTTSEQRVSLYLSVSVEQPTRITGSRYADWRDWHVACLWVNFPSLHSILVWYR